MKYATPELVALGQASILVLGIKPGLFDHGDSTTSRPVEGVALGLDD